MENLQEPSKEQVRAEQEAKRKLLLDFSQGSTAGSSEKTKKGKKQNRRTPTEEELNAAQDAIDKLFDTIDVLTSDAPTEEKKKATTEYLKISARLAAVRYLPFIIEHIELFNLVTSAGIWGGYRAYLLTKPMFGALGALAGAVNAFGGTGQQEETVKEAEAKVK